MAITIWLLMCTVVNIKELLAIKNTLYVSEDQLF
jgi:hypothetical protein